jgi:signal transduction histidine kinase
MHFDDTHFDERFPIEELSKQRSGAACGLAAGLLQEASPISHPESVSAGGMGVDLNRGNPWRCAFGTLRRVIGERRDLLRGLRTPHLKFGSLENALLEMIRESQSLRVPCRAFVTGKPKALKPEIQRQVCLIGREALGNALRHAEATLIEVEVEYKSRGLRLLIRDNGRGMDPQAMLANGNSHWGILGMYERARGLGAQLCVWSRRGLGTEVEVLLSSEIAVDTAA